MTPGRALARAIWIFWASATWAQQRWDIGPLQKEILAPSNIEVRNRCLADHTFELIVGGGLSWLELPAPPRLRIAPSQTGTVPVRIDTRGLAADTYTGAITTRCTDCATEPGCRPEILTVRMKVVWGQPELTAMRDDEFVANEVLVMTGRQRSADLKRLESRLETDFGLKRVRRLEPKMNSRVMILFQGRGTAVAVRDLVLRVQTLPELTSAQPNFLYGTLGDDGAANVRAGDPYRDLQYGLKRVRADEVFSHSTGKGVRIAILDTGIDYRHEDLAGQIAEHKSFFKDDREFETDLHGTMVAGLIAAKRGNGKGISGVAPDARLLAIKVCKPVSRGGAAAFASDVTLVEGLDYAVAKQAQIINLSLGSRWNSAAVSGLVRSAVSRGAVLVSAAGNDGSRNKPLYPAALEEVIAVTAIDASDNLYSSANQGSYIDLAAPGVEVMTTTPGGQYHPASGTSFAAPHVSALVALLLARNRGISPADVRRLLEQTARDLGAKGKDPMYGSGCVDACRLMGVCTVTAISP